MARCRYLAVICVLLATHTTGQAPPADWVDGINSANLLFSFEDPDALLMPVASNGFVGAVVGRGSLFHGGLEQGIVEMAGVFNGASNSTPSHRASVPSPWVFALLPIENSSSAVGAALDLQHGTFLNRTRIASGTPGCEDGAVIEQRFFASSCHLDLLMWQLALVNRSGPITSNCTIPIEWRLDTSANMTAQDFSNDQWDWSASSTIASFNSSTKEAETPASSTRIVAVALQHDGLAAPGKLIGKPTGAITLTALNPVASFRAVFHSDLDSHDPLPTAMTQMQAYLAIQGENLRSCSENDWDRVRWQSGIEVTGNISVARALNSSLYHLLAAGVPEWPFSYTPSGLGYGGLMPQTTPKGGNGFLRLGYYGHVFWDSDLWISTGLALLRPDLTGMIVEYRASRLASALERAQQYGFVGANWPWESAFTGVDCVTLPNIEGMYEQHISSDIALNLRWLYRLTGNETWLEQVAWPMLQPTCEFWHCRFEREQPNAPAQPVSNNCGQKQGSGNYTIRNVQPPDERAGVVNSSIYTNAAAAAVLDFCVEVASLLGKSSTIPAAEYTDIASSVFLPLSDSLWPGHAVHPEFAGYAGQQINQASVTLTQWPLQWPNIGNESVRRADLEYYAGKVPFNGMFTGDASLSVAALELGNRTLADEQWQLGLEHDNTPFGVWKERAETIGNPNFITGVGGMLQNVLNGFLGMRAPGNRTLGFFAPSLPLHTEAIAVRGVQFQGNRLRVSLDDTGQFCVQQLEAIESASLQSGWSPSSSRVEQLLHVTGPNPSAFRLSGSTPGHASIRLVLVAADGKLQPIELHSDVCTASVTGRMLQIQPA